MATEKIQIFEESNDCRTLQTAINGWLAEHPEIDVTERFMTTVSHETCWAVRVAIFYIEKPPERAAKAAGASRARGNLKVAK